MSSRPFQPRAMLLTPALIYAIVYASIPHGSSALPAALGQQLRRGHERRLLAAVHESTVISVDTIGQNMSENNHAEDLLKEGANSARTLSTADTAARRQLATTCSSYRGYVAMPDVDCLGDDIGSGGKKAASQCNQDEQCVAFNSDGVLKRSYQFTTPAVGKCLYVKEAFVVTTCVDFPGYSATPDKDRAGDNIAKLGSAAAAAAACTPDPRCRGFNSAGVTKSTVRPAKAAPGVCLYTKLASSSSPPPPLFRPGLRQPPSPPPRRSSSRPPPPKPSPLAPLPKPSPSSRPPSPLPPGLSPSPVISSAGCSDAELLLQQHNTHRALHGSSALLWDETLAKSAQSWAQSLVSAERCILAHDSGNFGENLYGSWAVDRIEPSAITCAPAEQGWYNEVRTYRFTSTPWTDNQANFMNIGHFTQVVWRSSTRLGCGAAIGAGGYCYVVACRYTPRGNLMGDSQFFANVKPAQ